MKIFVETFVSLENMVLKKSYKYPWHNVLRNLLNHDEKIVDDDNDDFF